jgi:hypothetical protein
MTELSVVTTAADESEVNHTSGTVGKVICGMSGKVSCIHNYFND